MCAAISSALSKLVKFILYFSFAGPGLGQTQRLQEATSAAELYPEKRPLSCVRSLPAYGLAHFVTLWSCMMIVLYSQQFGVPFLASLRAL